MHYLNISVKTPHKIPEYPCSISAIFEELYFFKFHQLPLDMSCHSNCCVGLKLNVSAICDSASLVHIKIN